MSNREGPPEGFVWTREPWGRGLRATALSEAADHVFTTRDLRLGSDEGDWAEVASAIGASHLVRLRQVHGADVVLVRRGERRSGSGRPHADILVSDDPSVAIAVQSADCVPLLIADPATGAVAAAHAGWRGLAARVPGRAVRALGEHFAAKADALVAAIGPSIGPCCYQVGPELNEAFGEAGFGERDRRRWFRRDPTAPGRHILDLWTATLDQLTDTGVVAANISVARLCTATRADLLPSYRRDGAAAGRIAGAIRAADLSRVPPWSASGRRGRP